MSGWENPEGYYTPASAAEYLYPDPYADDDNNGVPSYDPHMTNPTYATSYETVNPVKTGFNYNKKRRVSSSMVLQEDLDSAEEAVPRSVMINHSSTPPANFSSVSRGYRGGRGSSRATRGASPATSRGRFNVSVGSRGALSSRSGRGGALGSAKKPKSILNIANNHPAQAIQLASPGCTFRLIGKNMHTGIQNRYIVSITCSKDGWRVFIGAGPTEKVARHEAAYFALQGLKPFGYAEVTDHLSSIDTTKVLELREFRKADFDEKPGESLKQLRELYGDKAEIKLEEPVIVEPSKPPHLLFYCKLTIGDREFEEVATSKLKAEILVVRTALKAFEYRLPKALMKTEENEEEIVEGEETPAIADSIQVQVLELVFKTIQEHSAGIGVDMFNSSRFAGILLQQGIGDELKHFNCITAAVGAASIEPRNLKEDGSTVHDCHAEILAIRAFRLFLFEQLEKAIAGEESHLEKISQDGEHKYRLKQKYKVVMACNTMPLGDAMVCSESARKTCVSTSAPGALQFCIKSKYYTESNIAENEFDKPMIASLSDKFTMVNVAGLNGALLEQFLRPVYIEKYIMGEKYQSFSNESLTRSFYGRVEQGIYKVPFPYKINKPVFERAKLWTRKRGPYEQSNHMFSGWFTVGRDWEVIKCSTGLSVGEYKLSFPGRATFDCDVQYYEMRLEGAKKIEASMRISTISKRAFFERYKTICSKTGVKCCEKYFDSKGLADCYRGVKHSVSNAFAKAELGTWVQKTVNTDYFSLDTSNVVNC